MRTDRQRRWWVALTAGLVLLAGCMPAADPVPEPDAGPDGRLAAADEVRVSVRTGMLDGNVADEETVVAGTATGPVAELAVWVLDAPDRFESVHRGIDCAAGWWVRVMLIDHSAGVDAQLREVNPCNLKVSGQDLEELQELLEEAGLPQLAHGAGDVR